MIAARHASGLRRTHVLSDGALVAKAAGVMFAALSSAAIWVAFIVLAASLAGVTVSAGTLVVTGTAIATFLAAVCSPLMLKA